MIILRDYDTINPALGVTYGYTTSLDVDASGNFVIVAEVRDIGTTEGSNAGHAGFVDESKVETSWDVDGLAVSAMLVPGYVRGRGERVNVRIVRTIRRDMVLADVQAMMNGTVVLMAFMTACQRSEEVRAREFVDTLRDRAADYSGSDDLVAAVNALAYDRAHDLLLVGDYAVLCSYL